MSLPLWQTQWRLAFDQLILAASNYSDARKEKGSKADGEFLSLCSAAIALYRIEEQQPVEALVEVWPFTGWERDLHQAALAWAGQRLAMSEPSLDTTPSQEINQLKEVATREATTDDSDS